MRHYLFYTFLILVLDVRAQVRNSAYDRTLKALLSHSVKELTVSKAHELKYCLLLDARERREFEVSHIAGARFVGYNDFDLQRLAGIDKNRKIIVYCSVGYRSEQIANKLIQAGYRDVSNLYGGIFEWVNEGYPVVNATGEPTMDIHAYNKVWSVWLDKGNKIYDSK